MYLHIAVKETHWLKWMIYNVIYNTLIISNYNNMFPQRLYSSLRINKSYIIFSLSFQKLLSSLLPKAQLWHPVKCSCCSGPLPPWIPFPVVLLLCLLQYSPQAEQWQWPFCRKVFTLPTPHKNSSPDFCIKELHLLPVVFHEGREKIGCAPQQGVKCVSWCGTAVSWLCPLSVPYNPQGQIHPILI